MEFQKVSFEQWKKDIDVKGVDDTMLMKWYHDIKLPKQGAKHSMGVDFYMPYGVHVLPHNKCKIATGIRWICDEPEKYGMLIAPRSSTGIKLGLRLVNTIGVIDGTYWQSDNLGEIYLVFENTTDEEVVLPQGKAVAQGIIVPYIIPDGAQSDVDRNGGIGSSDNTVGHV